jgi:hypothetical protein
MPATRTLTDCPAKTGHINCEEKKCSSSAANLSNKLLIQAPKKCKVEIKHA